MKKYYKLQKVMSFVAVVVAITLATFVAVASVPIATDSRIKTLIYNESEVFYVTVHYGYQSNIEFAKNEEIEIISVGNDYSWKITPVGRRIFIKSLEGAARTNMTVITNKRTYQFEIESKDPEGGLDGELVYVVRFYYPDNNLTVQANRIDPYSFMPSESGSSSLPIVQPQSRSPFMSGRSAPQVKSVPPIIKQNPAPLANTNTYPRNNSNSSNKTTPIDLYPSKSAGPGINARSDSSKSLNLPNYNYNYTLEGPDRPAPLKVFDDGAQTFLQFPNNNTVVPHIYTINNRGQEQRVSFSRKNNYIVLNGVNKKLSLKLGSQTVYVYNETM